MDIEKKIMLNCIHKIGNVVIRVKLSAYIPKEKGGFLNDLGNKYIPEQYKKLYR